MTSEFIQFSLLLYLQLIQVQARHWLCRSVQMQQQASHQSRLLVLVLARFLAFGLACLELQPLQHRWLALLVLQQCLC